MLGEYEFFTVIRMNAKISRVAVIAAALVVVMGMFAYFTLAPSVAATTVNNQQTSNYTSPDNQSYFGNQSHGCGFPNGNSNGYPTIMGNNDMGNQFQQFQQFSQCQRSPQETEANLTAGQTIDLTSTQGTYTVVGNSSETGTASGTLTFNVTGSLARGYVLSLTSGSIVVNGTTYTITSGSAQTGTDAQRLTGQGETSPSGDFLISASASGNFGGTTAHAQIDFSNGTTEYEISLICTVVG